MYYWIMDATVCPEYSDNYKGLDAIQGLMLSSTTMSYQGHHLAMPGLAAARRGAEPRFAPSASRQNERLGASAPRRLGPGPVHPAGCRT